MATTRTPKPTKHYANLAERFRLSPGQLADYELADLRVMAREARNYLLERQCVEELVGDGHVVLTPEQARVVGAVLEVVREDSHHYGLVAPIAVRAGRQGMDVMLVVDQVVDAIQQRRRSA